ncbi:hypothetical protein pEaSNUABM14_00041 [Erwinia phage pEa_SNUABM_14]|nr:hypothetical protein pEaSNUABM13_00042 [Erwinia phage pEa_SNUABM_13]QYW03684.1 hypothetical protein pEaSNUABM45_00041 [Erwinia phage pEa_SNUABM_45]QYW04025.1 hypothetical protein pEaSNUABM46_00041 [Erwinia phage pEa_SNUABM_46]QYW04366.1 hypothetical protein pEaSNUABM14_00041 [Erwinia phage pEa_SNUABM_14]
MSILYSNLTPNERDNFRAHIHQWYQLSTQKSAYLDLMDRVDEILGNIVMEFANMQVADTTQIRIDLALEEWAAKYPKCIAFRDRSAFWVKVSFKEWLNNTTLYVERSHSLRDLSAGTCYGVDVVDTHDWPDSILVKTYQDIEQHKIRRGAR